MSDKTLENVNLSTQGYLERAFLIREDLKKIMEEAMMSAKDIGVSDYELFTRDVCSELADVMILATTLDSAVRVLDGLEDI